VGFDARLLEVGEMKIEKVAVIALGGNTSSNDVDQRERKISEVDARPRDRSRSRYARARRSSLRLRCSSRPPVCS